MGRRHGSQRGGRLDHGRRVRLLLVPAIMKAAGGKANWWLPGFLERILPKVKVE